MEIKFITFKCPNTEKLTRSSKFEYVIDYGYYGEVDINLEIQCPRCKEKHIEQVAHCCVECNCAGEGY